MSVHRCPECDAGLELRPELAGKLVACGGCGVSLRIPDTLASEPSTPDEFEISCPTCEATLQAGPEDVGVEAPCPACQTPILITLPGPGLVVEEPAPTAETEPEPVEAEIEEPEEEPELEPVEAEVEEPEEEPELEPVEAEVEEPEEEPEPEPVVAEIEEPEEEPEPEPVEAEVEEPEEEPDPEPVEAEIEEPEEAPEPEPVEAEIEAPEEEPEPEPVVAEIEAPEEEPELEPVVAEVEEPEEEPEPEPVVAEIEEPEEEPELEPVVAEVEGPDEEPKLEPVVAEIEEPDEEPKLEPVVAEVEPPEYKEPELEPVVIEEPELQPVVAEIETPEPEPVPVFPEETKPDVVIPPVFTPKSVEPEAEDLDGLPEPELEAPQPPTPEPIDLNIPGIEPLALEPAPIDNKVTPPISPTERVVLPAQPILEVEQELYPEPLELSVPPISEVTELVPVPAKVPKTERVNLAAPDNTPPEPTLPVPELEPAAVAEPVEAEQPVVVPTAIKEPEVKKANRSGLLILSSLAALIAVGAFFLMPGKEQNDYPATLVEKPGPTPDTGKPKVKKVKNRFNLGSKSSDKLVLDRPLATLDPLVGKESDASPLVATDLFEASPITAQPVAVEEASDPERFVVQGKYNPQPYYRAPGAGDPPSKNTLEIVDAYLRAENWQARLPYTYMGEVYRQAIGEYYEDQSDFSLPNYELKLSHAELELNRGGPYWVYEVYQENQPSFPLVIREQAGLLKIDWQSQVEFLDQHFVLFRDSDIKAPGSFRLLVKRLDSYPGSDRVAFKEVDHFDCYQLNTPYGDSLDMIEYAFVKKGTPAAEKLNQKIPGDGAASASILTLDRQAFSHGIRHFVITDFLKEGWLN